MLTRMNPVPVRRRSLALFTLALALSQAALAHKGTPASVLQPAAVLKALQLEIGEAPCDAPQQCRSLALGARACGGPERYLAWSTRSSDPARVSALGEAYAAARRSENLAEARVSNCAFLMDPGAVCTAHRCTLGGGDLIRP